MAKRSTVIVGTVAAAAALIATGSTLTSAATSEPTQVAPAAPAPPIVQQAAIPAPAPAAVPDGAADTGKGNGGRGDEGRGDDEGRGGEGGRGDEGGRGGDDRGYGEGRGGGGRGYGEGRDRREREGRIQFNERTYSATPGGCITAASGLGSTSFNVYNDSWRTVEVFSGATCDNGAPVATVGPHGATNGVFPRRVEGGIFVPDGVGASFRVIGHDDYDDDYDW
ncbi:MULTISPECIES: hypothetical protein [unclassified Streptomyces]|uniref:hypothetical protein n=1 Tax=unclassified Streptomyces TaxID=2593676 RepID=UPI0035E21D70